MTEMINQFHFLRPVWLFALIALVPIIFLLWRQHKHAGQWQDLISPELLLYLLEGKTLRVSPLKLILVVIGWIITCIALAGPSWKKLPVAVEKSQSAMVIILDLSPSMLTEDIKPSRIVRARLKIADLLRERPDGQTALLVYAANAHVVTPLTDDAKTITNLLPQLTPGLMPAPGSNTEEAVSRAIALLKDAGMGTGDLLIITDGIADEAQASIKQLLKENPGMRLSILGVGGSEPAPIPSRNGGFVRDKKNNIVTSYLDVSPLRNLAIKNGGRYKTLSNDPNEMQIFARLSDGQTSSETKKTTGEFDQWADAGYWLTFLLLPLLALAFRRGTLLAFLFLPLLLATPDTSYALSWNDLWKNSDQRAFEKLQNDNASDAAKEFTREDWQAAAEYRAGNYEEAAKHYAKDTSASGHYNRGNALAKSGKLPEAIKAYDQALKQQPDMEVAKKNRQLVEEALKKQEQQKQKQENQNKDDQEQQDQDQDQEKQDGEQDNSSEDQQNSSESGQQSSADQQQNSSADASQNQEKQNQESQNQESQNSSNGQQTSGQSSSASSAANESMQESLERNQQADSSLSSQAAMQTASSSSAAGEDTNQPQPTAEDGLTDEERKQLEQWLRRVPDDPSGLLRRKFEYEHYKLRQQKMNGTWEAPANDADQRL